MAVVAALPAGAQVHATVVTTDGERHTGNNVRFRVDRTYLAIRTSFEEDRRIDAPRLVYVDFGGTPDVNVELSGSQQAVVMRDGTVHKGQIIELGHQGEPGDQTAEFLVILRTADGEKRWPVNQVARVYFKGSSAVATTGKGAQIPEGAGIAVPGNQQWTPTGMTVRRGDVLTFNTTGEVRLGTGEGADVAGSGGSLARRYAEGAPLPRNYAGALIARVGNGQPFPIGDQTRVTMPAAGQLFLGINDDHVPDNSGGFRVQITRGTRRR
jgi:hypothetical protein